MAQALKHRKTRVLEGSRMEFGGEGGALVALGEDTHLAEKKRFTRVLATSQKVRRVQASKELTLSVLEDVSRGLSTNGCPTRRLEALKAPRRIYDAFGEHPAAGVCTWWDLGA